jgi:hypothetical protein
LHTLPIREKTLCKKSMHLLYGQHCIFSKILSS